MTVPTPFLFCARAASLRAELALARERQGRLFRAGSTLSPILTERCGSFS